MLSCSTAWSWCVVGCSQAVATQWELNLGEVIRFSLSLCTWYCPSYLSNVPSHTVAHFQQTQTHSDPLLQELCPRTHRSSEGRVHAGLWLDLNNFGLALWSFHFCVFILQPAPGGRKTQLTRHVSCTCGDTRVEAVLGQGKRWNSAPHQGAHPRRWVTKDSVEWRCRK